MKFCKKTLAMILTFALVMSSSIAMIGVLADGTVTVNIEDTFDNASSIPDEGWKLNTNSGATASITSGYVTFSGKGDLNRVFDTAVTSGKYEMSYKVKGITSTAGPLVYGNGDNTTFLFAECKNDGIYANCGAGGWGTAYAKIADLPADGNAWLTFKYILDFTNSKFTCEIYNESEKLISNAAATNVNFVYTDKNSCTKLSQIKIEQAATTDVVYVDDFILRPYEESEEPEVEVSFNETFDTYESWSDAAANGWSFNKNNISIAGTTGAKYVSFSEGEIHKAFTVDSGKYEISYSLKAGQAKPLVLIYNSSNNFHILSQCSEAGAVNTASWTSNVVANVDINDWMTVKHIVDLDNNTATCKVYDADGYLVSSSSQAYTLMNSVTDIAKLTIQNQKSSELLVDNVSVKPYTGEATDKTRLVNDTFDNVALLSDISGWSVSGTGNSAAITEYASNENATGKYVVFTGSNFKRTVSPAATSGKYKISYKLKPGSSKPIIYLSGTSTGNVLLTEVVNGKLVTNSWAASDMVDICAIDDTSKWIKIEAIIDVTNTSAKIKAYDENGALIASHERDHLQNVDKNAELTNFTTFNVDNWTTSGTLAFDDLTIESYVEKPELSANNVIITNYKGEIASLTSAVSPAVKSITLDFDSAITEASKALISISPAAEYTGDIVGNTYVMTFTKALSAGTDYTVSAAAGVANAGGETLGSNVSITFTTGAAVVDAVLASVTDASGTAITAPADLLNKTITVNTYAANCSSQAKSLAYIVALYNGDKLVNAYVADDNLTVPAGAVSVAPVNIPVGAHSNVTKAKIMLWDTLDSIVPYCARIEIPNN
ncbi:MAG: Ig-like domain-containing protein [Clostridia bacterium]|nr:Ig-like domain-containing protein [Clostridia bacterium]